MSGFRQVWVIQNKVDGLFLTPNLFWSKWLKQAGRCYDVQSAMDTGDINCNGDGYVLSSFWEQEET
jgi:hypothetical protein